MNVTVTDKVIFTHVKRGSEGSTIRIKFSCIQGTSDAFVFHICTLLPEEYKQQRFFDRRT